MVALYMKKGFQMHRASENLSVNSRKHQLTTVN